MIEINLTSYLQDLSNNKFLLQSLESSSQRNCLQIGLIMFWNLLTQLNKLNF